MGVCQSCTRKVYPPQVHKIGSTVSSAVVPQTPLQTTVSRLIRVRTFKQKEPQVDSRRNSRRTNELKNAQPLNRPATPEETQTILTIFQSHVILKNLDGESHQSILERMQGHELGPRELILKQGEPGNRFFVLTKGSADVTVNRVKVHELQSPAAFGDYALLDDTERTATIRSCERCLVWSVSRETFKAAVETVNKQAFEENRAFVNEATLFRSFSLAQQENMLAFMNTQVWETGQVVIREGDSGSHIYIIKSGSVSVSVQHKVVRHFGPGDVFGEQDFLHSRGRQATVTALTPLKLLSISHENLVHCFGDNLKQLVYSNSVRMTLEGNRHLKNLSEAQRDRIVQTMQLHSFQTGQVVIPTGTEIGKSVWVLLKGNLEPNVAKQQCVGAKALVSSTSYKQDTDVVAIGKTVVAVITRQNFERIVGGPLSGLRDYNQVVAALMAVPLLRLLPLEAMPVLARSATQTSYAPASVIFEEGAAGASLFIVKSGEVHIFKGDKKLRTFTDSSIFGEVSLIYGTVRTSTAVACKATKCWEVPATVFSSVLTDGLRKQLVRRIELQDDSLSLEELVYLAELGSGMTGNVFLCGHPGKKNLFALKVVSRATIRQYQLEESLQLERNILLELDHPMVMKLVKTFEDAARVCFLSEFVEGIDLFDVLREHKSLNIGWARFYTACLVLILEYLESKQIVYRDLKPENVIVDCEGYPKLVDMGTAKAVQGKTYTTLGTPHYMAPEVIVGSGYGMPVDWWSLGVMVYEFLTGDLPFGNELDDPFQVYTAILEGKLRFQPTLRGKARSFVEMLLNPKPWIRAKGSIKSMKVHAWMSGFDWNSLLSREYMVPYRPQTRDYLQQLERSQYSAQSMRHFLIAKCS